MLTYAVVRWTKGFRCAGVEGEDVVALLQVSLYSLYWYKSTNIDAESAAWRLLLPICEHVLIKSFRIGTDKKNEKKIKKKAALKAQGMNVRVEALVNDTPGTMFAAL